MEVWVTRLTRVTMVGSMFAADKLTYKIRHIYGGAVTDFRAFTKAVVA